MWTFIVNGVINIRVLYRGPYLVVLEKGEKQFVLYPEYTSLLEAEEKARSLTSCLKRAGAKVKFYE